MKIEKIEMTAFKGFDNASVDFKGKSTVFFGYNGSGKSSVLRAINLLYSNIINKIVQNKYKQGIKIENSDIKFGNSESKIEIDFEHNGVDYSYQRYFNKSSNKRTHKVGSLNDFYQYFSLLHDNDNTKDINVPVYVNYGIHRLVLDVPVRIRNTHVFDTLSTYEKAIESKIEFRTFFEWFRNREDYENQIKGRENPAYKDIQLECVRKAVLMMLGEDFSELMVYRNPLCMKIKKGNINLEISQLSDGEKCTLAMIGDLARRISLANPKLENPLEGDGVVLIDEIELHLHTVWQRRIIPTLRDIFPNIQFIITTHSPQVLNEISDDMNLFVLENKLNNIEITKVDSLSGWDINYILEKYMQTSYMPLKTKGIISHIYDLIDDMKLIEAKERLQELENMTNSKNTNVIEMKYIIDKLERK